jgi:hypothetical protein
MGTLATKEVIRAANAEVTEVHVKAAPGFANSFHRRFWGNCGHGPVRWAMRKYKRYNGRKIQAGQMIGSIASKRRKLFVHWHQSTVGAFA